MAATFNLISQLFQAGFLKVACTYFVQLGCFCMDFTFCILNISTQKQPSCEKMVSAVLGKKSCEIKGGSQEMAAMMSMLINFNKVQPLLKFININIIAAISWLPPLISKLFSSRLFKVAPFVHSLAVLYGSHFFFHFIRPQNQPMADFWVCFYSHFFFSIQTQ